jgi:hypothetical protein
VNQIDKTDARIQENLFDDFNSFLDPDFSTPFNISTSVGAEIENISEDNIPQEISFGAPLPLDLSNAQQDITNLETILPINITSTSKESPDAQELHGNLTISESAKASEHPNSQLDFSTSSSKRIRSDDVRNLLIDFDNDYSTLRQRLLDLVTNLENASSNS